MYSRLRDKLNSIYFNSSDLSEQQYKDSQWRLILSGTSGNILGALTAGSFLAGFLSYLGASNEFCAIMGAVPQFGCILQMFSPYIFEKLHNRKLLICICCFIFRFSLGTVIFVPFIVKEAAERLTVIAVIETIAFLVAGFVTPGWNNWNLTIAPMKNRGRYLALKDIISMLSVALVSLGIGRLLDHYKSKGNILRGFTIMFVLALILSILDFFLISSIREPKVDYSEQKFTLKQIIFIPLQDKSFRPVILFLSMWSFAVQFSVTFIPVYMVTGLRLSYSFISMVAMAGNILGMAAMLLWGQWADKTTWSFILRVSGSLISICYFGWFFVNSSNAAVLAPILQILLACCNGAFTMASINLQFALSPKVGRTAYLGVTSAVSCVISFGGALLGSFISKLLHDARLNILGLDVGNIQILFLITSFTLMMSLIAKKRYNF
ncbi:MAG: major facilitator superfamily 1 [Caproiciproducens sp.]|jgi:MFS family permease|nr:major facilitator superfamily 1 [Caproiciproducens sp.]